MRKHSEHLRNAASRRRRMLLAVLKDKSGKTEAKDTLSLLCVGLERQTEASEGFLPSVRSHYHSLSCCFQANLTRLCTLENYEKTKAIAVHSLSSFLFHILRLFTPLLLLSRTLTGFDLSFISFSSFSITSDCFFMNKLQLNMFSLISSASLRIILCRFGETCHYECI